MGPIAHYISDFLNPAHPTRMAVEPRAMPRRRKPDGGASIWPTATKKEIAQGYQMALDFTSMDRGELRRRPLRRLDRKNYSWIKHHFFRKRSETTTVNWIFSTYDDDAIVNFLQFDFDRHYPTGATPDDKAEIDHLFFQQVQILHEIGDEQGFKIVWTTSPGDIDSFTKKHVQGLYAWIKLDQHYEVGELRRLFAAFKEYHGLEVECCWDSRHRNIRLAGQEFVELADPETVTILHPVKKRQREALGHFAVAWDESKPANAKRLFDECVQWAEKQTQDESQPAVSKPKVKSSAPLSCPPKLRACGPNVGELISEPNTFKAATEAHICSQLAHRYQANSRHFDQAVEQAMTRLKEVRPTTSRTCSDQNLLRSTVTRWMHWYFDHYDPKKASRRNTITDRDREDRERIDYCRGLNRKQVLRHFRDRGLNYREKGIISRFMDMADKWNFRVAVKAIYDGSKAICSKSDWFCLLKKLKGILIVLVEKDAVLHKCRQWGLAQWFVDRLKSAKALASSMLGHAKAGRKRKKPVYGTAVTPTPSDAGMGSLCEPFGQSPSGNRVISSDYWEHQVI